MKYKLNDLESYSLEDMGEFSGLMFRKQVAYVPEQGTFFEDGDGKRVDITSQLLDHWDTKAKQFNELGVKIPMPLGHSEDAEKSRGEVVGTERALDKKGRDSLYAITRFRDEEAAKMAKTASVSIYSPPTQADGFGTTHELPFSHLAITDYPVIADSEPFTEISLSLKKERNMKLAELAKSLGLTPKENATDEDVAGLIKTSFEGLTLSLADATKVEKVVEPVVEPVEPKVESVSPMVLSLVKENREGKIDALVLALKVAPGQAEKLKAKYCESKGIALSLDSSEFDNMIEILGNNPEAISLSHETGGQQSDDTDTEMVQAARDRSK